MLKQMNLKKSRKQKEIKKLTRNRIVNILKMFLREKYELNPKSWTVYK